MPEYFTIRWLDGHVQMIDQRLLPQEVVYRDYIDVEGVAEAIHTMVIRGAPAIGAAAGYGLALAAWHSRTGDAALMHAELMHAANVLRASRPTAVNLFWAIERVLRNLDARTPGSVDQIREIVLAEAQKIADEDIQTNRQIGLNGQALVPDGARIFHHCNTGALATVGYGTALGVIRAAHEHGKKIHVYVDETRPRLQGARLTSWELKQLGIPHTVVVDGASGHIMRTVGADLCLVGCDRIAANGDVANKIGTFNLALAAHAHGVPLYSVGPTSTVDLDTPNGDAIPIEERPASEVTHVGECQVTPDGVQVANPSFDVTPARYVTAIITEKGIAYPPYLESLAGLKKGN
ncbi:MAG TPA: S-methyl-5-thioribose-1-phosphate isomerase [Anaerolineales bacterium]|nr:S-methyl-5-thioribose-1-phosphate isomerase [Anaerolineales bacterium]